MIDRIRKVAEPEKIILFGSYAYGVPNTKSDIDILVIMKSDLPRYKRSIPISSALSKIMLLMDIVVYTPQEVEEWSEVPMAFITSIIKNGKVIYEKNKR
ncbi:MAG: nucleotidyltransferase domain-containing protein [Bacteroidota bacterium]